MGLGNSRLREWAMSQPLHGPRRLDFETSRSRIPKYKEAAVAPSRGRGLKREQGECFNPVAPSRGRGLKQPMRLVSGPGALSPLHGGVD